MFLLFCCYLHSNAQNLVMNPSFEEHYSCDFGVSNVWECKHVFNPTDAFLPGTSDYYNACISGVGNVPYSSGGYQQARTGNAYTGLFITASNYQEYIQIKLKETLKAGVTYDLSFYANLSNLSREASDDMHVKFVADSIQFQEWPHELFVPDWTNEEGNYLTDTVGWMELSGAYTADGTENWMIIGCFYGIEDVTTQYVYPENLEQANYHIDDVSLVERKLEIPNIFTPNQDGINDLWEIDAEVVSVIIYNRWGLEVYSVNSEFSSWNGNNKKGLPCSSGVYYYVVTISQANDIAETRMGYLTLLR